MSVICTLTKYLPGCIYSSLEWNTIYLHSVQPWIADGPYRLMITLHSAAAVTAGILHVSDLHVVIHST